MFEIREFYIARLECGQKQTLTGIWETVSCHGNIGEALSAIKKLKAQNPRRAKNFKLFLPNGNCILEEDFSSVGGKNENY